MTANVIDSPLDTSLSYRRAESRVLEEELFWPSRPVLQGMTHALSNMLMPLREYPALIQPSIPADSQAKDLLGEMFKAAERLCEINQTMKQLGADPDAREDRLSLNLASLIPLVQQDIESAGQSSGARVEIHRETRNALIMAPYDALYHAVRHLLLNGLNAAGPDGLLTIRITDLAVTEGDALHQLGVLTGNYVSAEFRDNGSGVPACVRDTLFEPFISSRRGEGCGLGLSLVYRTVRHLNGSVLYAPNCQPGASFVILLPSSPA